MYEPTGRIGSGKVVHSAVARIRVSIELIFIGCSPSFDNQYTANRK